MLGDFEVAALSDGTLALAVQEAPDQHDADARRPVAEARRSWPIRWRRRSTRTSSTPGRKLVLIDAGAGKLFGPTLGNLVDNLKAAGYQPEQVDEIYITHMHGDHVGGLMAGDKLAFPNAIVRADKRDADFWLSQANLDAAPKGAKDFFKGAMASINPYIAAGKFKPFDGSGELVPGVTAVSTYGHTKGHTIYVVESKGQKMAVLGDLMHVAAVQFPNPSVTIQFDTDSKMAAAQRKKLYAEAARQLLARRRALAVPRHRAHPRRRRGLRLRAGNYSVPR